MVSLFFFGQSGFLVEICNTELIFWRWKENQGNWLLIELRMDKEGDAKN